MFLQLCGTTAILFSEVLVRHKYLVINPNDLSFALFPLS